MVALKKFDLKGQEIGSLTIEDELLKSSANSQMIKDYITALRRNARQWSASTQTRAEVNHSGKKPHAQKGTGLARQGYLGAPHYRGGGRVFAPRPKFDQHVRINKKERRLAIRHLLSEKILKNHVYILHSADLKKPQTKTIDQFLNAAELKGKRILFLAENMMKPAEKKSTTKKKQAETKISEKYENFLLSLRNIPKTRFSLVGNVSGYDVMSSQNIIILESAFHEFVGSLGGGKA